MSSAERRRAERTPFHEVIRMMWQDSTGLLHVVKGRSLDRSKNGLGLEAKEGVELRTVVQVQLEHSRPLGLASVRYCSHKGMNFVVGLEFSPGFHWHDAPAAGGSGA